MHLNLNMSDEHNQTGAGALVRSILAKNQVEQEPNIDSSDVVGGAERATVRGPEPEPAAPCSEPPPDGSKVDRAKAETSDTDHRHAVELIELYFGLDDPLERDACFDELAALPLPVVTDFFRAMHNDDEDEYVRMNAAAELARRGDPQGRAALKAELTDPTHVDLFSQALSTLSELDGEPFYERLMEIWQGRALDADLNLEVLAAMESLAPERALADFARTLEDIQSPEGFRDDEFEVMILAFVRAGYREAEANLTRLSERAAGFDLPDEDRRELLEFIDEGLALVRG